MKKAKEKVSSIFSRYKGINEGFWERTDVTRLVVSHDGLCELLVHAFIIHKAAAFINDFGLGSIWNRIMQSRPQHLNEQGWLG